MKPLHARGMRVSVALVAALSLAATPGSLAGQGVPVAAPVGAGLSGRVLDAVSGAAVRDALVTLEALPGGLLVDARSASVVSARSLLTGESGGYLFGDLAPGRYRLRIERLGYRSSLVDVEVRRPVDVRVSVGLELEPVALEPLEVEGAASPLFGRAANRPLELEEVRERTERERQALFLTPDSRMLTYADVMDGVTLGEGDVFRALQRFPGVATRDDYSAELWTRGAPWTQTRVTFDGVPLFNPVHAVGVLSAIAPEVLGAVFFHPGVRPAELGDGAAGAVDLRSRAGSGTGELRGVVDLSMASAKLALEQSIPGRAAWLIAARRSHLDVLSGGIGWLGLDTLDLPYVFGDVAGRLDVQLGARARLEGSGLWEQDRVLGDVQGVLERTEARWGNAAARVTLVAPFGGLDVSHTLALSRFEARTDERLVRTRDAAPAWTEEASRNELRYGELRGDLAGSGPTGWTLGYHVTFQDVDYDGPWPRYHPVKPDTLRRLRYQRELWSGGLWGEARIEATSRLTVSPGLRLERSSAVEGSASVSASPRLALRYQLSADHSLSLAAGRSWQTTQAVALGGPSIHPAFHASHFWVLAEETMPAIRSDLVSAGSEHWLGGGWLASVALYARHATGVALADPTPGPLAERARPFVMTGVTDARGVEVGVRRMGALWSTSAGYSYGVATAEAKGWRYPAPADRRHVLDAMISVRLHEGLRVAGAYTAMSGTPFTRAISRSPGDCALFGFGCGTQSAAILKPNAERTPPYRSLDLSLHGERALGRLRASAYLQVRNVLGRDNASTYSGSVPVGRDVFEDRFEAGLPRVPMLGLRVSF